MTRDYTFPLLVVLLCTLVFASTSVWEFALLKAQSDANKRMREAMVCFDRNGKILSPFVTDIPWGGECRTVKFRETTPQS